MVEDATAIMERAINLLWCRIALISLKIMNILQDTSMEALRRGTARLPVSYACILQRVMAKDHAAT
jgi:hypothetical protein